jgi:hypothetical protein
MIPQSVLETKREASSKLAGEFEVAEKHTLPHLESVILTMQERLQTVNGAPDYEAACTILLKSFEVIRDQIVQIPVKLRSAGDIERGKVLAYDEILESLESEDSKEFEQIASKFEGQSAT